MAKSYYTLLLIPEKKNAIRKVTLSSSLLKLAVALGIIIIFSLVYFSYDYAKSRQQSKELAHLRNITEVQKEQMNLLAAKIGDFEKKMSDIRQFDRKIRIMTNIDNGKSNGQFIGMGGPMSEDSIMNSRIAETENELIENIHRNIDQLLEEASFQEGSFRELYDFLKKQKSILASTPSIWPVMGWVTSEFGYRISPFTGKREFHKGIDIATKMGEDIVSPADGVVTKKMNLPDMGNMLKITHCNGITTCYGHMSKVTVKRGQKVKRGDVVGQVGNSGRSTGPHLHYGVCVSGVYVNPRKYLF